MRSDSVGFESTSEKLPWWTWVLPLPVFFIGTLISLEAKITTGTSLFYFPLPFALTLTYWWGPRVLLPFYINAAGCAGLWGLNRAFLWPVYGLPEVIFVFLSWFLFVKLREGKVWLPNAKQIIYFLLLGILAPLLIYKIILELIFLLAGDAPSSKYWNLFITTSFGDFISAFCISVPLLFFFTRPMGQAGLLITQSSSVGVLIPDRARYTKLQWMELIGVAVMAYFINNYLNFIDYWFLNGLLSLYVAIRMGIAATILMNSYILVITYVIPAASHEGFAPQLFIESAMLKTQLGTCLLYVFTIITGRMVTDMRVSERRLSEQNKELNQMASEMDRFVYSVSHDLSAPLKSILGLVNISRITESQSEHRMHFDLIEKSVNKLEAFVSEVLDYSKNKRGEVLKQEVNIKEICREVVDDLKFMEGANETEFDLRELEPRVITSDKMRLKMILRNIISNAIKFRKQQEKAVIKLYNVLEDSKLMLFVEDNGMGMRPEVQSKIFEMFFRGNEKSNGSGLGLYIAREAAQKIGANISVRSEFGKGATFITELPVR